MLSVLFLFCTVGCLQLLGGYPGTHLYLIDSPLRYIGWQRLVRNVKWIQKIRGTGFYLENVRAALNWKQLLNTNTNVSDLKIVYNVALNAYTGKMEDGSSFSLYKAYV